MKSVDLIKKWEGCKLKAYPDVGGRWTIGYGATGPGIEAGVEWTQREADERLAEDVAKFEKGVRELVKVPLTENQFAALVSFAYNLGLANLKRSGLLRLLNQEKYKQAADQFLLWSKVGSYAVKGLTNRREDERKVFLSE